jgi:hypothetical protein
MLNVRFQNSKVLARCGRRRRIGYVGTRTEVLLSEDLVVLLVSEPPSSVPR